MPGCGTHNLFFTRNTDTGLFFFNDEFDEKKIHTNSIIFHLNRTLRLENMKALKILKISANPITRLHMRKFLFKTNVDILSSVNFLSLFQTRIYMYFISNEYSFLVTEQSFKKF